MAILPIIDLPEDPLERGRQHGKAVSASVKANIATYFRRLEAGGLAPALAERLAAEWERVYADEAPEYHTEMTGIAEGANVPLARIILLNARYELAYGVLSAEAGGARAFQEPDGCTSFGLEAEATADGKVIIGQNWDWLAAIQGHTLITRVRRSRKPSFIGFTEAGIAGCKMGLNEAGIGMAVNGLVTAEDGVNRVTRPFHVRCRDILDAERFDQAIGAIVSTNRTCSANVLIGHADGELIDIEATPNFCSYIYPENGIVTHSNHLVRERRVESLFERLAPHTLYRGPRLRRLLASAHGRLDLATITECLSDHFARPASICRHTDPNLPQVKQVKTICAMVMDLAGRTIHASAGPPCEHPLTAFDLFEKAEHSA